jgi:uncharacterized damage-inducible protein DinB
MRYGLLVEQYLLGPEILRRSISGMSDEQLNASPIPFKWSTRQVVLHLADIDLLYVDHMKRVIAEKEPTLLGVDEKMYLSRLAYDKRDVDEEVRLIKAVRRHMGRILRAIDADDFERKGIYSAEGPVTLADILQRATDHIPHHAQYIEEKRKALDIGERVIPFHLASVGVMKRAIA